jgi:hypothetical protein
MREVGRAMSTIIDRQNQNDAGYIQAYREWISNLPPAEQAALAAQGLAEPDAKRRTSNYDPELALALATANPWDRDEGQANGACPTPPRPGEDIAAALALFCARVRAHSNPLLAFDTLCFATGLMGLEGRSQAALAELHGVSRAAFSKQVVTWLDIFELSPPRGCRSARMREKLRKAERPAKAPRKFSSLPDGRTRRPRIRYPDRSADPTVVFVRGLDLFRRWFKERCRKLPLRRWTPEAREILRIELGWFARLHAQLSTEMPPRSD